MLDEKLHWNDTWQTENWTVEQMLSKVNKEHMLYLVEHPRLTEAEQAHLERWIFDFTEQVAQESWWINENFFKQDVFGIVLREMARWETEEDFDPEDIGSDFDNLFDVLTECKDPSYWGKMALHV